MGTDLGSVADFNAANDCCAGANRYVVPDDWAVIRAPSFSDGDALAEYDVSPDHRRRIDDDGKPMPDTQARSDCRSHRDFKTANYLGVTPVHQCSDQGDQAMGATNPTDLCEAK